MNARNEISSSIFETHIISEGAEKEIIILHITDLVVHGKQDQILAI